MGASNTASGGRKWYALRSVGGTLEGEPVFMTSIKRKPEPPPDNLEERDGKYFLTYTDIDGVVEALDIKEGEATYNGRKIKTRTLTLVMSDNEGSFNVDMGKVTGRYSMNFLGRVLNSNLDISLPIVMTPYKFETKEGNLIMGVNVTQKGVKIEGLNREGSAAIGCPEAVETEHGLDFTTPARWLFKNVREKLAGAFLGADDVPPPDEHGDEEPEDKKEAMKKLYGGPEEKPKQTPSYEDDGLPF